jgi:phosphate transport system permease protein
MLARLIIQLGGTGVILSILAIFIFLILEVAPLFFSPTAKEIGRYEAGPFVQGLPQSALTGLDEQQEIGFTIGTERISFYDLPSGRVLKQEFNDALIPTSATAVARAQGKGERFGLGTGDGRILPFTIDFSSSFESGNRVISPSVVAGVAFQADPTKKKIVRLAYQTTEAGPIVAALTDEGHLWLSAARSSLKPDGTPSSAPEVTALDLTGQVSEAVTALAIDSRAENLSVGTAGGHLYHFDVREITQPILIGSAMAASGAAVTVLSYLIGDRALVVGTETGNVSVWMPVPLSSESNVTRLERIHHLAGHPAPITAISPSQRDKGFITGDAGGNIFVHYSTSEQTLIRISGDGIPIQSLMFAPKANGALALDRNGRQRAYAIDNPHPEITLTTLFGPVWYEGYDRPAHVWQSSGASDDFEAKFGLTPLIFGTLKGTLYALLLAVPLAVLAAIYTAMFMHPDLRAKIKPVIEIMAALPTVVLGFLAGLWMAPLLERIFPAVVGMVVIVPVSVVLASLIWQFIPRDVHNRLRPGAEFLLLIPVIAGAMAFCVSQNLWLESFLFDANYKEWVASTFGLGYDQRNALVVGFAMGFAIIPIIFSISEEALSNVPKNLIAGSLALGATRWQTLARLVFISASPGIFSALMIGFGRAVGETMIVLMATGNTPIMDWSLFNGFRTLSANIAVEIPEAPHSGTLYRTLFLAALLLFVVTFVLNTGAEIIRQRLRKKYSQF